MMFISTILISCIIIALNNNISTTVHAVVENSNSIKSITNEKVRHNNVRGPSNNKHMNIRRRLQDKPDDDQVAVGEILDEVSVLEEEKKEMDENYEEQKEETDAAILEAEQELMQEGSSVINPTTTTAVPEVVVEEGENVEPDTFGKDVDPVEDEPETFEDENLSEEEEEPEVLEDEEDPVEDEPETFDQDIDPVEDEPETFGEDNVEDEPPGSTIVEEEIEEENAITTPSPSAASSPDALSNEEDEGLPKIVNESTPSPTPDSTNGEDDEFADDDEFDDEFGNDFGNDDEFADDDEFDDDDFGNDEPELNEWNMGPTNKPTPKPTSLYISTQDDPLGNELEPDTKDFNDDVLYHGLGGQIGDYLDQVESPQEMEKDKNVQVIAGIFGSLLLILLLVTAHLVMNHPDGLCAGCFRLTLKVICCLTRTICLPCRALCCKSSEQSQNRRSHQPMRTPFPSDLELT